MVAKPAAPPVLLSLAMIVKNEEAYLEEALRSAAPYVDEMVVVDTGSTDRTVEIALSLGARVERFAWTDDFSEARNFSLRACRGQYVLVLDADERLHGLPPEGLRPHLKPRADFPFEGFAIKVVNVTLAGETLSTFLSVRIFPNDPRIGYVGRVHNRLCSLDPAHPTLNAAVFGDYEIRHFGYDKTVYRARKKAERSLPLILQMVGERPDDPAVHFYLGRELLDLDRAAEAQPSLERAVDLSLQGAAAGRGPGLLGEVATHLLLCVERTTLRPAETLDRVGQALEHVTQNADLWYRTALLLKTGGRRNEAVHCFTEAVACIGAESEAASVVAHRPWALFEALGHTLWDAQRYPDAYAAFQDAVDVTPAKPAESEGWPALLNCLYALGLELGDTARAPEFRRRLLERDDTPLGMFFFEVERLAKRAGVDAARTLLSETRDAHPRIARDAEFAGLAERLGLPVQAPEAASNTAAGPSKPLRVLIGTANIAAYVENLAGGLRALGHEVTTALVDDNRFYPDFRPDHRVADLLKGCSLDVVAGEHVPRLTAAFTSFLLGFDLYIFIAAQSLLPGGADLPLLRAAGKTIVGWLCGSESRHHTAAGPMWAAMGSTLPESVRAQALSETATDTATVVAHGAYHNTLANRLHHLRMYERYADVIFSVPECVGLGLRPYQSIPTPLDLSAFTWRVPGREIPVVVHAPSNRGFKQTQRILAAFEQLQAEGVRFELRLLENLPNVEIRAALADADVVVDQMSLYPAILAHEGMASGCAVLTGNVPAALPVPWDKPCVHIEPDNLVAELRRVLTDRALRLRLAAEGRTYVENYADRTRVAARVLADVDRARRGDFDLYPTFAYMSFERPAGETITPRSQALALEVVTAQGVPAEADLARLVAQGLLPAGAPEWAAGLDATLPRWPASLRDVGPWIRLGPRPDLGPQKNREST